MTKINTLVDKIVTKSVLTLLQVVNLSFVKPFYALDEFCEIAFLDGLHKKSLLINELFFSLALTGGKAWSNTARMSSGLPLVPKSYLRSCCFFHCFCRFHQACLPYMSSVSYYRLKWSLYVDYQAALDLIGRNLIILAHDC